MSIRSPLWILLALAIFPAASATAAPPNVVLIVADDQHWRDYAFMGHPHLRTPNLDRLAREGKTTYQRNLSLGAGFESRPRGSAATFAILLGIDPVACLALVHEGAAALAAVEP